MNTIKDIDVTYENNMLTIKSVKDAQEKEVEDNDGVLHKGIVLLKECSQNLLQLLMMLRSKVQNLKTDY